NLVLEPIELPDRLRILLRPVKQRYELGVLLIRLCIEGQDLDQPACGLDLTAPLFENFARAIAVGQQIGAVAQESGARPLEGPPDAHAERRVTPRKVGDQKQPGWSQGSHCCIYYDIVILLTIERIVSPTGDSYAVGDHRPSGRRWTHQGRAGTCCNRRTQPLARRFPRS